MTCQIDSLYFEDNFFLNEPNTESLEQKRMPFTDITKQMKNFNFCKINQSINTIPIKFNDHFESKENFSFLKKKSHGEIIKSSYNIKENQTQIESQNKIQKYNINNYKKYNSLTSINEDNLDEEKENINTQNIENIYNNKCENELNFIDILNNAINEKKDYDKFEKDKKKAYKLKQLKMSLKKRKNALDYSFKNEEKINIDNNIPLNFRNGFEQNNVEKENNILMNID